MTELLTAVAVEELFRLSPRSGLAVRRLHAHAMALADVRELDVRRGLTGPRKQPDRHAQVLRLREGAHELEMFSRQRAQTVRAEYESRFPGRTPMPLWDLDTTDLPSLDAAWLAAVRDDERQRQALVTSDALRESQADIDAARGKVFTGMRVLALQHWQATLPGELAQSARARLQDLGPGRTGVHAVLGTQVELVTPEGPAPGQGRRGGAGGRTPAPRRRSERSRDV